jgi:hypothetical protein
MGKEKARLSTEAEAISPAMGHRHILLLENRQERATPSPTTFTRACAHQRLIDDILTRSGKRTGKVRCLECGAAIY